MAWVYDSACPAPNNEPLYARKLREMLNFRARRGPVSILEVLCIHPLVIHVIVPLLLLLSFFYTSKGWKNKALYTSILFSS